MRVTTCCHCFSLKTGVLIIGIIHLIATLCAIVGICVKPADGFSYLISLIIQFLISVLLLIGIQKRAAGYVFPFLCVYFANIILMLPITFIQRIEKNIRVSAAVWEYPLACLVVIVAFALSIYFFVTHPDFNVETQAIVLFQLSSVKMVLTLCCGCFTLETGTLMIGILHLIISLASIIVGYVQSIEFPTIITCIIHFFVSILLVIGVRKRAANYTFPLLSVYCMGLILEFPIIFIENIQESVGKPVLEYLILHFFWLFGFALCIKLMSFIGKIIQSVTYHIDCHEVIFVITILINTKNHQDSCGTI
ncbi:hypothetical protein PV327_001985 [Microctonus hyperodae]|uniref:Uncharacterized protein n=1 Tax=Microctonus hyperodae TaxID=165561 RepID=A0AA39FEM2_MICHY|nr:hypothetical protein PV327_001985 [Microctonus hyperodae]